MIRSDFGLALVFLLVLLPLSAAAQSSLPLEVQADLLKNKLTAEIKSGKLIDALKTMDSYKALNVQIPLPVTFLEAKISHTLAKDCRALKALETYFKENSKKDGSKDERYAEALELYLKIEEAVKIKKDSPPAPDPFEFGGMTVENINPANRDCFNLPDSVKGVVVVAVEPKSSAASFKAGDVIQKIEKSRISVYLKFTADQREQLRIYNSPYLREDLPWEQGRQPVLSDTFEVESVVNLKEASVFNPAWRYSGRFDVGGYSIQYKFKVQRAGQELELKIEQSQSG